jgi:hypothetical protein
MTNTSSQILKRTAFYGCLLFTSLLFVNCSNDDVDDSPPPTYEFGEKFEDIDDLPEVVDEDLATPEPDAGKVAGSEETPGIVIDVMGASTEEEVAAETKASLSTIKGFTENQPAAVAEAAESLDEAGVDAILDNSVALDATLADLETALGDVSAAVAALLPTIQLSVDFEGFAVSAHARAGIIVDLNNSDIFSQAQTAPCFEAAQDAFNAVKEDFTAQVDTNLSVVEANYTRRQSEADARLVTRTTEQATRLEANIAAVKITILSLLEAADNAESFGSTEIASELRQLALYYAVYARTALDDWNTAVLEMLEVRKVEEKAAAEERRDIGVTEVTASFDAAIAEAQVIFQTIDSNCHNQGSGN